MSVKTIPITVIFFTKVTLLYTDIIVQTKRFPLYSFNNQFLFFVRYIMFSRFSYFFSHLCTSGPRISGRADQLGGLAVVLQPRGPRQVQHRRHLLADGDGRPRDHTAARRYAHETWIRRELLHFCFFGGKSVCKGRTV